MIYTLPLIMVIGAFFFFTVLESCFFWAKLMLIIRIKMTLNIVDFVFIISFIYRAWLNKSIQIIKDINVFLNIFYPWIAYLLDKIHFLLMKSTFYRRNAVQVSLRSSASKGMPNLEVAIIYLIISKVIHINPIL